MTAEEIAEELCDRLAVEDPDGHIERAIVVALREYATRRGEEEARREREACATLAENYACVADMAPPEICPFAHIAAAIRVRGKPC